MRLDAIISRLVLLSFFLAGCVPAPIPTATSAPADTPVPVAFPTLEPSLTPIPLLNSIETIISDMQPPHDASPHGVPASYDWSAGPRMGLGNNPGEFTAIIPWGQVYECAEGNLATNTRVHIRNIGLYILSKSTGQWKQVQRFPAVAGAAYREDLKYDANRPADERIEPEGGLSVIAGDGYNYHFFTWRDSIDSDSPDDRAQACYLLSMGADYWRDLKVGWNAQFTNNGDVAIGKFKRVTVEWQAFNMTSLSADEIRKNPPPIK